MKALADKAATIVRCETMVGYESVPATAVTARGLGRQLTVGEST